MQGRRLGCRARLWEGTLNLSLGRPSARFLLLGAEEIKDFWKWGGSKSTAGRARGGGPCRMPRVNSHVLWLVRESVAGLPAPGPGVCLTAAQHQRPCPVLESLGTRALSSSPKGLSSAPTLSRCLKCGRGQS